MTWTPHATVATIIEENGKYLLVEETSNGREVFNQPAGHIEENESILAAALRETLEETGYRVELTSFLGVYTYKPAFKDTTYFRFCFAAKTVEKTALPLDKDIIAAHWLSYDEITTRKAQLRSPLVLKCIDDYRAGIKLPLSAIVEYHTKT